MSEHETETRALTGYRAISLSKRPYLLVMAGPDSGRRYSLGPGEVVLGRSAEADIVLDDSRISRRHVRITVDESAASLDDLSSTNGTYLNNRAVGHSELLDGDLISLGRTILKYTCQAEIDTRLHEELISAARLDGLTGLLNRRSFFTQLEAECARVARYGGSLSLLVCDLDDFKTINDTHGHGVGDMVLRLVAEAIRTSIRRSVDQAGRYGGDELVVLLPETDSARARAVAEKILAAVAVLGDKLEGGLRFGISIGISTLDGDSPDQEALLHRADENLYRAKAAGRNRVEG